MLGQNMLLLVYSLLKSDQTQDFAAMYLASYTTNHKALATNHKAWGDLKARVLRGQILQALRLVDLSERALVGRSYGYVPGPRAFGVIDHQNPLIEVQDASEWSLNQFQRS